MKPAMTREEWDTALRRMENHDRLDVVWYESKSHHSCAALCLHNQPFGFTREDVDALDLLSQAKYIVLTWRGKEAFMDPKSILSIKDRIEALLPPEEE